MDDDVPYGTGGSPLLRPSPHGFPTPFICPAAGFSSSSSSSSCPLFPSTGSSHTRMAHPGPLRSPLVPTHGPKDPSSSPSPSPSHPSPFTTMSGYLLYNERLGGNDGIVWADDRFFRIPDFPVLFRPLTPIFFKTIFTPGKSVGKYGSVGFLANFLRPIFLADAVPPPAVKGLFTKKGVGKYSFTFNPNGLLSHDIVTTFPPPTFAQMSFLTPLSLLSSVHVPPGTTRIPRRYSCTVPRRRLVPRSRSPSHSPTSSPSSSSATSRKTRSSTFSLVLVSLKIF